MLLPLAALLLLASGAPNAAPPAAPPRVSVVVLRDGTRYTLSKPYEIRGTQARFSLTTGSLVAVRASEIDEEASKKATETANAPPPPAPTATPPTLAAAAAASSDAPKKASKTLTIEGDPNAAQPVTGGSTYAPSSSSEPKGGPVKVRGYTTAKGTHVDSYTRAAPGKAPKK